MTMYVVTFAAVAVTAARDLVEINASASRKVRIHGWEIGQSTEFSDAADEQLRLELIRGFTTSGGGSAFTALPIDAAQTAAFGGTCEIDGTLATGGTSETVFATAFNVRSGHVWIPTPEMRVVLAESGRIVLRMNSTPADSISFSGSLYFEEL